MASKSLFLCQNLAEIGSGNSGRRAVSLVIRRGIAGQCVRSSSRNLEPLTGRAVNLCSRHPSRVVPRIQSRSLTQDSTAQTKSDASFELAQSSRLSSQLSFTDRGSGIDGAIKLAFSATAKRYGEDVQGMSIIGLKGGEVDTASGYFFDFPRVVLGNGRWHAEPPLGMKRELCSRRTFQTLTDVFDIESRKLNTEAQRYRDYALEVLEGQVKEEKKFGAALLEPVVLASGNMEFVDPLFQYSLVQVIRENPQIFTSSASASPTTSGSWSGLPVIFDETFTGSYRLGRSSSASLIHTQPDIAIRSSSLDQSKKQCIALTSSEIADSSTSTPVTQETEKVLSTLKQQEEQGKWDSAKKDWDNQLTGSGHWSMWSFEFLHSVSMSPLVKSCMALGSVLVVKVHAKDTGSWNPKTASGLQRRVKLDDPNEKAFKTNVVAGNTFYVVGSPLTEDKLYRTAEETILETLYPEMEENAKSTKVEGEKVAA